VREETRYQKGSRSRNLRVEGSERRFCWVGGGWGCREGWEGERGGERREEEGREGECEVEGRAEGREEESREGDGK